MGYSLPPLRGYIRATAKIQRHTRGGLGAGGSIFNQGTLTIERVRALVAQLSVANPAVSQALSLVAKALNDTSSPALSPLDQTANQLAEVLGGRRACDARLGGKHRRRQRPSVRKRREDP